MAKQVHALFNATDSDITIMSSDHIAFKLHRKYLDSTTGVFPGEEVVDTKDESIQLTEPARVLAIVFQFIYPKKHPKLNDEGFDTILAVAEAVEKYQVFAAMNTCETRLLTYLPGHSDRAVEILTHGIKHDYPDLINAAVPLLARAPLIPLVQTIPSHAVLCWIRYQEQWKSLFKKAIQRINTKLLQTQDCNNGNICISCHHALITRITELERLETLSELTAALDENSNRYTNHHFCGTCRGHTCVYNNEVTDICREGIKNMPSFTGFLSKGKN